jgi:hypothetical protein
MGYYHDNVLPRIMNTAMDTKVERATRGRVCADLHGQVVEIGFGSGLNAAHYPAEVTGVFAIDRLDNYYAKGAPKPMGYTFEGRALKR